MRKIIEKYSFIHKFWSIWKLLKISFVRIFSFKNWYISFWNAIFGKLIEKLSFVKSFKNLYITLVKNYHSRKSNFMHPNKRFHSKKFTKILCIHKCTLRKEQRLKFYAFKHASSFKSKVQIPSETSCIHKCIIQKIT